jgi:hypothetical protein
MENHDHGSDIILKWKGVDDSTVKRFLAKHFADPDNEESGNSRAIPMEEAGGKLCLVYKGESKFLIDTNYLVEGSSVASSSMLDYLFNLNAQNIEDFFAALDKAFQPVFAAFPGAAFFAAIDVYDNPIHLNKDPASFFNAYRIYQGGKITEAKDWYWRTDGYVGQEEDEFDSHVSDEIKHYVEVSSARSDWIDSLCERWLLDGSDTKAIAKADAKLADVLRQANDRDIPFDIQQNDKEHLAAVEQNGVALQYVSEALRTAELCLAAVEQNGYALQYVPNALRTAEIYVAVIKNVDEDDIEGFLEAVPKALKAKVKKAVGI